MLTGGHREPFFTGLNIDQNAFSLNTVAAVSQQDSNPTAIPFSAQAVYEFDLRVKENPS